MALTRTLEMLKAGERINDLLYRSTMNGSRRLLAGHWTHREPGAVDGVPVAPAAARPPAAWPFASDLLIQPGTGR